MSRSRFLTGLLLGAPLAVTVALVVIVTAVLPGIVGNPGALLGQVGGSTTGPCINGYAITEFSLITASDPAGITMGPDGNLWLTESYYNTIWRITPGGAFRPYSTVNGRPNSIVAGPDGNLWFAELTGNTIGRITPGGVITKYPIPTVNSYPIGMTSALGFVWFTESAGHKIGRIAPDGTITEFPLLRPTDQPSGIALGSDGNLWFTEPNRHAITRMTPAGVMRSFMKLTGQGDPSAIVAGPDGNLWFTEPQAGKIGKITPDGTYSEYSWPNNWPMGIATGADGNLWVTGLTTGKIGRFAPSGLLTAEYVIPTAQSYPGAIAAGPGGSLWFTETRGRKIGTLTPCTAASSSAQSSSARSSSAPVSSSSASSGASSGASSAASSGSSQSGTGDICTPICGDGKKVGPEQCDDGNIKNGDGCSSTCRIEGGSSSATSNNSSTNSSTNSSRSSSRSSASSDCPDCVPPNCGNTVLETALGEQCDDGNTKSGDGCSLQCKIERVTCPADPCGKGGTAFCALQGKTCQLDATKTSCITCIGSDRLCAGNECELGGKAYCSKIGNNKCVAIPDGICIDCKNVCLGNECGAGGDKYCDLYGKKCISDMASDACIDCFPEPPIVCSGADAECNGGGTAYCGLLGQICSPKADGICIACLPPGTCKGGECAKGGAAYCSAVRGGACTETADGICISCDVPRGQAQCLGNECRKGGAAYCKTLGEGCKNIPFGLCIDCVPDTRCSDDLQCAEGSTCVNGACVALCGNKRLDPGEICDPTVGGAGNRGCTAGCLLAENQQCERDTECGTTLCKRNACVPCTTGRQCQSNECRKGTCTNLCGNAVLDPGEICDPGLAGASADCTGACLRPVGTVCAKNFECQTGLCGTNVRGDGSACIRCERNNQCGSGICSSGACVDVCGNGTLDRDEQCDDGNRISGDGCSRFCEREARVAGEILPITLLGEVTQGSDVRGMRDAGAIAKGHPAAGETGPAAVIAIAGGAAAGWSYMRRRRRRDK